MNEASARSRDQTSIIVLCCLLAAMAGGAIFFALRAYQMSAQLRTAKDELAGAQLQVVPSQSPVDAARRLPIRALLTTEMSDTGPVHVLRVFNLGPERLGLSILVNHREVGGAIGPISGVAAGGSADFSLRRLAKGDLIEVTGAGPYDPVTFIVQ